MQTVERIDAPGAAAPREGSDDASIESDVFPVRGGLLPMLTIAMGVATCLWGCLGIVLEGSQATAGANAMFGAGACFILSGLLMQSRSLLLPAIAGAIGILLGVASRMLM